MSILCCHTPQFLLNLTHRHDPTLAEQPVALLGPEEQVCAVSPQARQSGVRIEMTPRQAQMRCPDVQLRPLDMQTCQEEQAAFLTTVSRWQLPVEAPSWGMAYVDMQDIARNQREAQPLAMELGRGLREQLGEPLQPTLGWDSSKFTARAAASSTQPGRMRLVGKTEERRFLAPLSIHLLPLSGDALQQLHWLGIRTLGQFAALPSASVTQRFGQPGHLAQRWARGLDERPVRSNGLGTVEPIEVELESPTDSLPIVLDAMMVKLKPQVEAMARQLEGWRHLRVEVAFLNGETRSADLVCIEPVSQLDRLRDLLGGRLAAMAWPAEACHIAVLTLAVGELPALQLALFPDALTPSSTPDDLTHLLAGKYGSIFFAGGIADEGHPVDERRIHLVRR